MPTIPQDRTEPLARFRTSFDLWETFGLARPRSMSLSEFLGRLADHGLLDHDDVGPAAASYHRLRYGGNDAEDRETDRILRSLDLVQERFESLSPESRESLTASLKTAPDAAPPEPSRDAEPAFLPPTATFRIEETDDPPVVDTPRVAPEPRPPGRDNRSGWIAAGLLLWSVGVFAGGHFGHDTVTRLVWELRVRFKLGVGADESERLATELRDRIEETTRHQDRAEHFRELGDLHWDREEYAEAFVHYRKAMSELPADADVINLVSWKLLTVDEDWYRDPREALQLARQAHEISDAPHVLDTLAEANYQNGFYDRAVELERVALAKQARLFFRKQLEKFEAAQERQAADPAP